MTSDAIWLDVVGDVLDDVEWMTLHQIAQALCVDKPSADYRRALQRMIRDGQVEREDRLINGVSRAYYRKVT